MPTSGGPPRPSDAPCTRPGRAFVLRLLAAVAAVLLALFATGSGTALAKSLVVMDTVEEDNRTTVTTRLFDAKIHGVYSTHHVMSELNVFMNVPERKGTTLRIPITLSYEAFPMPTITEKAFSVRDEDGKESPVKNTFEFFTSTDDGYVPGKSPEEMTVLVIPDAPEHGTLHFNGHAMKKALPDASICYSANDAYHPDYDSCFGGIQGSEEDFHPEKCTLSNMKFGFGFSATVVVTSGRDFVLSRERFSDGTVSVTILSKSSITGEVGLGGNLKMNLGRMFDASARIFIGAGVSVQNGSTWLFDDVSAAKRLERLITSVSDIAGSKDRNPFSGLLAEKLAQPAASFIRPHIVREGANVEVSDGFDLGVGLRDPNEAAAGGAEDASKYTSWITERAGVKVVTKIDAGVAEVTNRKAGTTSHVYTLGGAAGVNNLGYVSPPIINDKETGTLTLTFDSKDRVTEVVLSHLHSVKRGVRETVTSLKVESAAERRIVDDWLEVSSGLGALPVVWDSVVVTDPSTMEMNPFDELMHEKGVVLRSTHTVEERKVSLSAQFKVLVSLGLAGHVTETSQTMTKAEYLQSPLPVTGERQFGTYRGCH